MLFVLILFFLTLSSAKSRECKPPKFEIIMKEKIYLSEETHISVQHDNAECAKSAIYHWDLYLKKESEEIVTGIFDRNNETTKNNIMHLSRSSLMESFYKYKLRVMVTLIPLGTYNTSSVSRTFEVTPKPMELKIDGGLKITHVHGCGPLIINASNSKDPSFPGTGSMDLDEIRWMCDPPLKGFVYPNTMFLKINPEVYNGTSLLTCTMNVTRQKSTPHHPATASISQTITISYPTPPKLTLKCIKNCYKPNPLNDTILEWRCLSNCLDHLPKSECRDPKAIFFAKADIGWITVTRLANPNRVMFHRKTFPPGKTVNFRATMGDASAVLTLTYMSRNPKLNITCIRNCRFYDIALPLIFRVTCEDEDCEDNEYDWKTSPDSKFKLSKNETEITIPADTFKNNEKISVTVRAWNTTSTITATMKEFIPKFSFNCTIEKEMKCPEFIEPESSIKILIQCNCSENLEYKILPKQKATVKLTEDSIVIPSFTYSYGDKIEVIAYQGKFNETFKLKFRETSPDIVINCTLNCDKPANTHLETKLIGSCPKCKLEGFYWTVSEIDQETVNTWSSGLTISIPPVTFQDNQSVSISLHNEYTNTTFNTQFVRPKAHLTLVCLANCIKPDPFLETVFNVTCKGEFDVCSDLEYRWELNPKLSKTRVEYEEKNSILKIKERSYDDNNVTVTVHYGTTSASQEVLYAELVPELKLVCIKNCEPFHPAHPIKLQVTCDKNCAYLSYSWNITNPPATFNWLSSTAFSDDKSIITINAGTFKDGDKTSVSVSSGKTSVSLPLDFVSVNPQLNISCKPPCNEIHNPMNHLLVWVNCTKHCYDLTNYVWNFHTFYSPFNMTKSVIQQKNSESILILPDAFINGTTTKISVNHIGTVELKFYEPPVTLDIICSDNCSSLNAFVPTNLTADCKDNCSHARFFSWVLNPPPSDWALNVVTAPFNKSLIINAETYEEDADVNVTVSLRNSSVTKTIHFIKIEPKLSIHCLKSCSNANPFEKVEIEVKCDKYCDGLKYIWDLTTNATIAGFNFSTNTILGPRNKTFTIVKNVFNDTDTAIVSVSTRRAKVEKAIHFFVPVTKIHIYCVENCDNDIANPLKDVILNVTCEGTCYNNHFDWTFKPPPAKEDWRTDIIYDSNKITILRNAYRDKGSVRIFVANYQSKDQKDIHFVEPTPILSLICPTCTNPNPDEPLALFTYCKNCHDSNYVWEITPQLRSFDWSKNVIFGASNESITIEKDTYQEFENVAVIVKYGKAVARLEFQYKPPNKTITITCVDNCISTNPYKELKLNVTCEPLCGTPEYSWSIVPLPKNFNWSANVQISHSGQVFNLAPNSFKSHSTINVTVKTIYSEGSISLTFAEGDPDIELICIENCEYNPNKRVMVEMNCSKFCDNTKSVWSVVPKADSGNATKINDSIFVITENLYQHNDLVTVTVKVRGSNSSLNIRFRLPDFNGSCNMEPSEGIGGITEFYFDCIDFINNPFFRLYQEYKDAFGTTRVLLSFGYNLFPGGIILSENNELRKAVTLEVGVGWETRQVIYIPVNVQHFPTDRLPEIIVGTGKEDYFTLIKTKNTFKAAQLASAISTALDENSHHEIQHIASGVIELASHLEPIHTISLLLKLTRKFGGNPLTGTLIMKGVRKAVEGLLKKKHSENPSYTPTNAITIAENALFISVLLLTNMMDLQSSREDKTINPDYAAYTDYSLPDADLIRHAETFTADLLATVDDIVEVANNSMDDYDLANFSITIHVKGSFKIHTREAFALFEINPFWWADKRFDINTVILRRVIHPVKNNSNPDLIKLEKNLTPSRTIENQTSQTLTYLFLLAENSLFSVEFNYFEKAYVVTIGSCMPGTLNFKDQADIIRSNKVIHRMSYGPNMYVSISPFGEGNVKFKFNFSAQECFSWKDSELSWRKDLCNVSDRFNITIMDCSCKHSTYYGGRTYIPEEQQIGTDSDFDDLLFLHFSNLSKDYSIPVFVVVATGIFLLLLLLAHRQDLAFYKNNKVHFVEDNVPGDKELYLLLITTGMSYEAGTSANVAIKISGKLGQSRVHILSRETNQMLKRNSENFFAIYAPKFLGDIKSIKLWHNSCGSKPHWYCESVLIKHPRSHKEYLFEIQRWFSLLYGDGTTEGTFRVSKIKPKFSWKLRESFRSYHHLLSFYTKRPRPGTSKETVLIAFASISTVMMAVVILLQNFHSRDTFSMVMMGCASALSSIPVAYILGWLFHNSR